MESIQSILAVIGSLTTVVGLVWTITTFFLPPFQEHRNKKYLENKLGRGPYDIDTIQQATKYYIRPKCSNIDPSVESEPRYSAIEGTDLIDVVDFFLQKDTSHRHLLLLADSGMGKSSFVLNYYAYNARLPRRKRQKISIVPLGIPNVDDWIHKAQTSDATVIILDGFDEDVNAIRNFRKRVEDLMEMCQGFRKVIITCRTQFFQKDSDVPSSTGLLRIGPTSVDENKYYEFKRYYLLPFNDKEVLRYINKRFSLWQFIQKKRAFELIHKIPLLSVRPMLLAHIPDLLVDEKEFIYSYQIYEAMIDAWIKRESFIENKNDLRRFSNQLAVDLYNNSDVRKAERIPYEQLSALASQWGISIEHWRLSSRSLLNRDADGNFKFAHRSIMEYLFVKQLIEHNEQCYGIFLTDQMLFFLQEILNIEVPNKKLGKVAVISKSLLINKLLNKNPNEQKTDHRLGAFAFTVAKGLAWSKISSELFSRISQEISKIAYQGNHFRVSEWGQIEESLVALVANDKNEEAKMQLLQQMRNLLENIPSTFPRPFKFEEVPGLKDFIVQFWAISSGDVNIGFDALSRIIKGVLNDKSIYFWGDDGGYWNPWFRINLYFFLSSFGVETLKIILTIQNSSSLFIPLFNDKHSRCDGHVMIVE